MTDEQAQGVFLLERLSDGIIRILERHVDPWLRANIWLIPGRDRSLLIDSGMGLWPLQSYIQGLVEKPVLCLSTHCHYDHAGGAYEFNERLSHPSEAEILKHPSRENVLINRFVGADTVKILAEDGYRAETYCIRPCPPSRPVDEGDVIDLGDRLFRVVHLPGHSPGSIGVWEEHTGILFSGDAVYDGELYDDYYHSSPEAYQETMRRMIEMPLDTIHPGHYASFGRPRFKDIAEDYLAGRRSPTCPASAGKS